LSATIVIVTRNRREDALRAVRSAVEQSYEPLEVLVYDDASTDGTAEAVHDEFPEARLVRGDERVGYIALRNRGFREAVGEIIFSIDDDAYFSDSRTVEYVIDRFAQNPRAAALALQYLEPGRPARLGFLQGIREGDPVRNYIGCAHAIRRVAALAAGGYREWLVHQGEERDLCLRLLERGHEVRYVESPPVVHEPSPQRDHAELAYLGLRNTFLFDVVNVPVPDVLWRLPIDVAQLLKYRVTWRTCLPRLWNVVRGLAACLRYLPRRDVVTRATYRRFRDLTTHGPVAGEPASSTQATDTAMPCACAVAGAGVGAVN
jgi:GT2 family glycosyltransferase